MVSALPALVGDDTAFLLSEISAHAGGQPEAPMAAVPLAWPRAWVQCVHHVEDITAGEAQAIGWARFQLKVCADVEGVTHTGLDHLPEDWGQRGLCDSEGPICPRDLLRWTRDIVPVGPHSSPACAQPTSFWSLFHLFIYFFDSLTM